MTFPRLSIILVTMALLSACSPENSSTPSATQPTASLVAPINMPTDKIPAIQSDEWFQLISRVSGVVDEEGHGPDPGDPEWCGAVHFRVYGIRVPTEQTCNPQWFQNIHHALIHAKP